MQKSRYLFSYKIMQMKIFLAIITSLNFHLKIMLLINILSRQNLKIMKKQYKNKPKFKVISFKNRWTGLWQ